MKLNMTMTLNLSASHRDTNNMLCCAVTTQPASEPKEADITFVFADSSLIQEWKDRVTQSLKAYADVFAQQDLDFGHASKVRHHINLKDETPFKQKSRPMHPTIMKP